MQFQYPHHRSLGSNLTITIRFSDNSNSKERESVARPQSTAQEKEWKRNGEGMTSKFAATSASGPQTCNVALLGFGTVGSSVAKILCEQSNAHLRLTHVLNRNVARKKVDWLPSSVSWTENIDDVLSSGVDIVVEVMGGLQPSGDWIRRALSAGKSVVTANKQLIAQCGPELTDLARQNSQQIYFGASVAGGVPVISGLHEGLAGDAPATTSSVKSKPTEFPSLPLYEKRKNWVLPKPIRPKTSKVLMLVPNLPSSRESDSTAMSRRSAFWRVRSQPSILSISNMPTSSAAPSARFPGLN
jgi:hypothetical protein